MGEVLEFVLPKPQQETQFCRFCGGEILADSKFCSNCGKPLAQKVKSTKAKNTPKTKHTKEPIRTQEEMREFQACLHTPSNNTASKVRAAWRNYVMFTLGCKIGVRASDLTVMKVSTFFTRDGALINPAYIVEIKTNKGREVYLDSTLETMLREYIAELGLKYDDNLCWSQRPREVGKYAGEKILSPASFNDIIVGAAKELNKTPLLYGSHTMRKTFGYNAYEVALRQSEADASRALDMLCSIFGHSSPAITLIYIGINKERIMKVCGLSLEQYDAAYERELMEELKDKDNDM